MKLRAALSLFLMAVFASHSPAQISADGGIRGYVRDAQGGALPGVTVTATTPGSPTKATTVSDGEGAYRFPILPPGDYSLVAELSGFAKHVRNGVQVQAGKNIAVDLSMHKLLQQTIDGFVFFNSAIWSW